MEIKSPELLNPLAREWYLNPHISASNVGQADMGFADTHKGISGLKGYGWGLRRKAGF